MCRLIQHKVLRRVETKVYECKREKVSRVSRIDKVRDRESRF